MASALAIVNRYLNLTSCSGADLRQVAELLADDVVFEGPLIRTTVRDAHIGLLQQFLPSRVSTRVLRQLGGRRGLLRRRADGTRPTWQYCHPLDGRMVQAAPRAHRPAFAPLRTA